MAQRLPVTVITGFCAILNPIPTKRRKVTTCRIAGLTNAVGIVVIVAGITKFTIGDFVVPTIRCIPITGGVTALPRAIGIGIGCAIITGFPGLTGAIAAARAWLVGGATDIVKNGRADALVGFAAFGAFGTGQAFPVGWAVRRAVAKQERLVGVLRGFLAAGWQYGGEERQANHAAI